MGPVDPAVVVLPEEPQQWPRRRPGGQRWTVGGQSQIMQNTGKRMPALKKGKKMMSYRKNLKKSQSNSSESIDP